MSWKVNDKRKPKKNMSSSQKKQNRKNSQIRARVEHCFRVIKCQFGYKKASYKGLVKNAAQVFTLLGLANLYMLRGRLGGGSAQNSPISRENEKNRANLSKNTPIR